MLLQPLQVFHSSHMTGPRPFFVALPKGHSCTRGPGTSGDSWRRTCLPHPASNGIDCFGALGPVVVYSLLAWEQRNLRWIVFEESEMVVGGWAVGLSDCRKTGVKVAGVSATTQRVGWGWVFVQDMRIPGSLKTRENQTVLVEGTS